jgi:hypothetical protein
MTTVLFHAYAGDSVVDAYVELPEGKRLTDHLNEVDELSLGQVQLTALDDGRIVEAAELVISTTELHAVQATDPGGHVEHRIRTRSSEVEIVVGPYRVEGYIHGPTAGDPLASLSRRGEMVPVTSAKIGYMIAGQLRVDDCDALIVNRLLADIDKPAEDAPSILNRLGLSPVDPNAKDLTGELSVKPVREEGQPT